MNCYDAMTNIFPSRQVFYRVISEPCSQLVAYSGSIVIFGKLQGMSVASSLAGADKGVEADQILLKTCYPHFFFVPSQYTVLDFFGELF